MVCGRLEAGAGKGDKGCPVWVGEFGSMRADRLLQVLWLLQRHERMSARELGRRLEVSTRTIQRDMEALSAAGVPVYTERGRNGGCVLLPGYRADVSELTPREAQALFAWSGRAVMGELGLDAALRSAMGKLASTLPRELQDDAEALSDVLVVDRRRWFSDSEDTGALPALRQAVVASKRIRLAYRSASEGKTQRRTVDPWGLVEQAGRWYLVAAYKGKPKMYRVSRVERIDVLDEQATKPDNLDLKEEWRQLRRGFEQTMPAATEMRVRVRPDLAQRFRQISTSMLTEGQRPEDVEADDEWVHLRMRFRVRQAACAVLLGFGNGVEVLEPEDLRHDLTRLANEVIELYNDDPIRPKTR